MKNNREKILMVDDVEENVLLIKHLLQKDYKIVTALGGRAGSGACRKKSSSGPDSTGHNDAG